VSVRKRLVTAGVLTFVAGLVLFFPARVAYQWFLPPEVRMSGIRGTIWNGTASEAMINQIYLRELRWQIHGLDLFALKLSYSIKSKLASGFVETDIAIGISGTLAATNLSASMPISDLQPIIGIPGLQGNLAAHVNELRIENGLPVVAIGNIKITGLAVPFISRDVLGNYSAEFITQQDAIVASLEDVDAAVDLAGSLTLANDRSYQLLGHVAVTAKSPPGLKQYLSGSLGPADARGQHQFRLEGVL
jgi:general secretion pathway protein N